MPAGLTGSDDSFTDTITQIKLSGGSGGSLYKISNTVTMTSGQIYEAVLSLSISGPVS